jgi:hypothetical protein
LNDKFFTIMHFFSQKEQKKTISSTVKSKLKAKYARSSSASTESSTSGTPKPQRGRRSRKPKAGTAVRPPSSVSDGESLPVEADETVFDPADFGDGKTDELLEALAENVAALQPEKTGHGFNLFPEVPHSGKLPVVQSGISIDLPGVNFINILHP